MKILYIALPVVAVGVVLGLGFSGVIQIPGISPKKALKNAAAMYAQKDDKLVAGKAGTDPVKTITPTPPADKNPPKKDDPKKDDPKAPKKDPDQGADALATVWDKIQTAELIKISAKWKDEDLARVLAHMDPDKVADILQTMAATKPDRASKLSQTLQDQGSIIKAEG